MSDETDKKKIDKERKIIKSYGEKYKSIQKGFVAVKEPDYTPPGFKKPEKKSKEEAKKK